VGRIMDHLPSADDTIVPVGDFFVSRDYETVTVAFPGTAVEQRIDCLVAASTDFDLTGQILWLVSKVLAHHLAATDGRDVRDKVVLELGAGAGLVGMVCSQWARSVVLSDYEDEVLTLLQRNVPHCRPACRVVVSPLSWGEAESHARALALSDELRAADAVQSEEAQVPPPRPGYDVIVGADVVYWSQSVSPLLATAAALLAKPDGVMLIGYTARVSTMRPALLAAAAAVGLHSEVVPWEFGSRARAATATGEGGDASVPASTGAPPPPYPPASLARTELFKFTWAKV
jgi:predicted nicotinamide N-methyase